MGEPEVLVSATVCAERGRRSRASSVSADPPLADVATTSVLSPQSGSSCGRDFRRREYSAGTHARRTPPAYADDPIEEDHPLDARGTGVRPRIRGETVGLHDGTPSEQSGQCRVEHVRPSGQVICGIDDLAQHLLCSEGVERGRIEQTGVAEAANDQRTR